MSEIVGKVEFSESSPQQVSGSGGPHWIGSLTATITALSVITGVVISVLSLNAARTEEAIGHKAETVRRAIEAARPFLEM